MLRSANPVLALSLVAILGVIALAGCSDSNNPAGPGGGGGINTTFSGMFSGAAKSGKLNVTVNTTSLAGRGIIKRAGGGVVTASGTADIGASTIIVAGTYDTNSNNFSLTGGGYTFGGMYEAGTHGRANVNGFWSGPGGIGGSFICYLGNSAVVTAYCGRYHSNSAGADSAGNWTFGVFDTLLAGYSFGDSANALGGIFFEGKVSATGNPRIVNINYNPGGYTLVAPGTIDTTGTDTVTGTFTFTPNGGSPTTGSYSGALCP